MLRFALFPVLLFLLLLVVAPPGILGQPAQQSKLPPISWTCPMHPDVIEDHAGQCPICGMALDPVRLDSAWSCPIHPAVSQQQPGRCPICQRDLVQVGVSLFWTCAGSDKHEMDPGPCPDGTQRIAVRERRAHGDHNPRHGGVLFMAPDNWHHVEGTYPEAGVFRLFVYDDFTRPLALEGMRGRVVGREVFDPKSGKTTEIETFQLGAAPDGRYLEARVGERRIPAELTAKIRFKPDGAEHRFDFVFSHFTREPQAGAAAPAADSTVLPAAAGNAGQLVVELEARGREIERLIREGDLAAVWVPALAAKDIALQLELLAAAEAEPKRSRIASAVKRLVIAAWLLDTYADQGDRKTLTRTYDSFSAALAEVAVLYGKGL